MEQVSKTVPSRANLGPDGVRMRNQSGADKNRVAALFRRMSLFGRYISLNGHLS